MAENKKSEDKPLFEEIVKKTKTGITFPKILRELLFEEETDVYFKMVVPKEKDKIILEFLSVEQAKQLSEKFKATKPKSAKSRSEKKEVKSKKSTQISPSWGEYFVYDFEAKDKIIPILE